MTEPASATMPARMQPGIGAVVSLWRYPVKSMLGEELDACAVTAWGLLGDRAYAVLERCDGLVASAKNPRKWPRLLQFRAEFPEPPRPGAPAPPVRITLPDETTVSSDEADVDQVLSAAFGRQVRLRALDQVQDLGLSASDLDVWTARAEEYRPDIEGLDHPDTVSDFDLSDETFFDCAVVHLLTTATLDWLRDLNPQGRFDVRRFRPNIVIRPSDGRSGFVEDAWIGRTLRIGDEVRLAITRPCARCVMTTLAQADLPADSGILRTAVEHNQLNVGVYAAVVRGGRVHRGDAVDLL